MVTLKNKRGKILNGVYSQRKQRRNEEVVLIIYITGDTHGEYTRFSKKRMKKQGRELTEQDYVIVCGDFGLCWAKDGTFEHNCNFFAEKRYTVLWIQGNHENYDMIAEYPTERWHGGKVRHIVRNKVILLERGQVFEIDEKTFFTFGGASSHDIQGGVLDRNDINFDYARRKAISQNLPFRVLHESWWPQELPDEAEMNEGRINLERHNYKVDYVITHCCSTEIQSVLDKGLGNLFKADILTDYLQELEEKLQYSHWYFGHYHMDIKVDEKHSLLYQSIISLEAESTDLAKIPVAGRARYRLGDMVRINWNAVEKIGKICVVDAHGTFVQNEEPSYDILVEEDNCIYKHICESDVLGKAFM